MKFYTAVARRGDLPTSRNPGSSQAAAVGIGGISPRFTPKQGEDGELQSQSGARARREAQPRIAEPAAGEGQPRIPQTPLSNFPARL